MAWGALGCSCYLLYGIKKVVPIVLDGLGAIRTVWQWALLAGTLLFFAYYEGYKGFQKGFSPRVVRRAWVVAQKSERPWPSGKELLKRYGFAYLATSISLSSVSIATLYALVRRGFDVAGLMSALGLAATSGVGEQIGSFAIAYALHKAASPVRFPITVALTPLTANCLRSEVKLGESPPIGFDPPYWHKVLAPAFCIGYFHGTRRRVISSWCVTAGIFLIVVGVKRMANPYRAIIDAGVMLGLSWGAISILVLFARSLIANRPPAFDPALPEGTPYRALPTPA